MSCWMAPGVKTLPSRLGITELARLAADGARPAGPSPLRAGTRAASRWSARSTPPAWSAWQAPSSTSATSWPGSGSSCGWMALGSPSSPVTGNWRGPCRARFPPVTGTGCAVPGRLRLPRSPPSGPVTVQRRVSSRGGIMVATQKIQVGLIHAGKIVAVTAEDHSFRLVIDGQAV